ncbi:High affinity cAMP-specific 3',5'-cyclic phosphodiesterase 7A [Rhizophlyctis rosea]|nr:High affinity cAMP-specific 3',5'-cyclic phosphodiesterase 7A [Rhizophlyctis rosea]
MTYRGFGTDRPPIWTKSLTRHTAPGAGGGPVGGRPASWYADGAMSLSVSGVGGTGRALMGASASRMPIQSSAIMSTEAGINELGGSSFLRDGGFFQSTMARPHQPFITSSDVGDNASITSRNIRDKLKELGHPLRGPIMIQMATHYLSFLLLLWVAYQTEWSPNMRFYMAYFYFHISIFILQISRMSYARNPNSVIPFYISLAPFVLLTFISREAHMIVMVLWYVSFLIIYLQSGNHDMTRHLIYYSITFIIVYYLCIVGMYFFYRTDCSDIYCGVGFADGQGINFAFEAVLCGACGMVVLCFVMLERFIKLNASTLLERDNYMNQLYHANIDLKRQLRRAKSEKEVDLEAPLARATQILRDVKETQELDKSVQDEIDFIMGILASDQLYNPNLYQKPGDADVHDWLNNMLLTEKDGGTVGRKGTTKQPSFASDASAAAITARPAPGTDNILQKTDLEMFALLEDMDNPNYDVADLARASGGRELYYIAWYIFRRYDFFEKYQINERKFRHWLIKVEGGYRGSNPYHNATHAADVTHAMHYYVTRPRLWNVIKPEEQLASIIAPIIHDYMHPGVNNAFLIATLNPLALRYNDQAVLENFHCSSIFEMMHNNDEYDVLSSLPLDTRKTVREFVISMVMATDMSQHFDWIGKFKTKLTGTGFNFDNKPDRKLVLNVAIKCADINNPAKPLEGCRRWTEMIMEEFFMQGEEEKRKGVPVSPMMDREKTDIPKCQIVSIADFENLCGVNCCSTSDAHFTALGFYRFHCFPTL